MKKKLDFVLWFFDISFITFAPVQAIVLILKKDEGYLCAIYILGFFSIFGILRMLYRLRNSLQTFFVCLGIWIIVLMCLFPPWVVTTTYSFRGKNVKATKPLLDYGFLLNPPELKVNDGEYGLAIDFSRLGLQCGIVVLLTGGLYYTLTIAQKRKDS